MWDVVVIGAGMAGIAAAQQLQRQGHRVLVLEKSRGLGGRLATRRVDNQPIDHGCRFFQASDATESELIQRLLQAEILAPWRPIHYDLTTTGQLHRTNSHTYYVAPLGMTAVAKFLAAGLEIQRLCRVTRLTLEGPTWKIDWQNALGITVTTESRSVIAAIPAPQIMPLLSQAGQHHAMPPLLQTLERITLEPVVTVMAGYPLEAIPQPPDSTESARGESLHPGGWMICGQDHNALRWVGLDSSKRLTPTQAVVVLHSTPGFAAPFLGADQVASGGQALLEVAQASLGSWFTLPTWHQTHRWRYGFVHQTLQEPWLGHNDVPRFKACGDWCLGSNVEAAFRSGQKAAEAMAQALTQPAAE